MSKLSVFNFQDKHQIRVIIDEQGNPQFVAKDVAEVLGYKDTTKAIKQHCGGGAKHHPILDSLNREQNVRVIYEPDLYRLIFGSKLDSAVKFQNWVFEEVLPSIRKTGSYSAEPTSMSVSSADWTRYLQALTIPEMVKLTGHSEKGVISGLYHATHSGEERAPQQPTLPNIPPQVQTALDQFWDTVSQLDLQAINHSRDPQVLAISLPEIYSTAGEQLPQRRSMLSALKHSLIPQFKDSNHAINSTITGNTKKCWVFVMPNKQE